jgi:RNA recognition motif-containing protein
MPKRIYVENISSVMTEKRLSRLFSQIGPVYSVRILRDANTGHPRECAVIEMVDDAANKAIAQLNGIVVDGRTLTVKDPKDLASWLWQEKTAA